MNKEILKAMGFGAEVARVENGQCATCSEPVDRKDFKDVASEKEFEISGMCQKCQDGFFK
jgi:hypothetical protein